MSDRGPRVAVVVFPGTWSERDFVARRRACSAGARERSGTRRPTWATPTRWCCPAASPTATICAPGPSPASRRSWPRFRPSREPAGRSSARATASRSCARPGMLPGALMRNDHLQFRCDWQWLRVERRRRPVAGSDELAAGDLIRLPISHGEGRYYADDATLDDAGGRGPGRAALHRRRQVRRRPTPIRTARCATSPASSTSAATCSG